jgi:hypothetical protein
LYQCRCTAEKLLMMGRMPETCGVIIPIINLELSVSVGFIHKAYC